MPISLKNSKDTVANIVPVSSGNEPLTLSRRSTTTKSEVEAKCTDIKIPPPPGVLNVLKELSDALGADAKFSATVFPQTGTEANTADVHTKTAVAAAVGAQANTADVYSKTSVDASLAINANAADVYTETVAADKLINDTDKLGPRLPLMLTTI